MNTFIKHWAEAAYTTVGFFWMALWAFVLGYFISSMIQVFVTEKRMQKIMGKHEGKGVLLGTFFGFISSSCSFAALATTKSLFQKGASFISSIAFLLASTNLVIELGIVISIFLGWQFVVGEYVGGILLIGFSWLIIKLLNPKQLIENARNKLKEEKLSADLDQTSFVERIKSKENWKMVGMQYGMEWKMVWKDVTVGFTIAGIAAVFVPDSFFESLFINSGNGSQEFSFFTLLQHVLVGPFAAFLTFIGSMGNIPLAALLFGKGVSFAGVMAFIFSDLVVFPVLRINARYYGWKMALFMLFLLFASLVIASLLLHYSFEWFDLLPTPADGSNIMEQNHFKIDYGFYLNLLFLVISGVLVYLGFFSKRKKMHHHNHKMASKGRLFESALKYLSIICYAWLAIGLALKISGIAFQ
ncbi:MAG: permease [Vicingaceae bacterium]